MEYRYIQNKSTIVLYVYTITILFSIVMFIIMAIGYKYTIISILLHIIILITILFSVIQIKNEYGNVQKIINNKSTRIIIKRNIRILQKVEWEVNKKSILVEIKEINMNNKTITLFVNKKDIINKKINLISLQILFSLIPKEYIKNTILIYQNNIDNSNYFYFPDIYYIASTIKEKNNIIKKIEFV